MSKYIIKPYAGSMLDLTFSFLFSHAVIYFFYWISGGNFERDWLLGLTELGAWIAWGYLLTLSERREKAAIRRSMRGAKKALRAQQENKIEYL